MADLTVSGSSSIRVPVVASSWRLMRRELLELLLGFALIMLTLWSLQPYQTILFCITTATIVGLVIRAREQRLNWSFRMSGLGQPAWIVLAALIVAAGLVIASLRFGTFHSLFGHVPIWFHIAAYTLWAFEQEFVLQFYFLARLLRIFSGKNAAIFAAATLFSVAHLPNPLLTVITLAWGAIACTLFLRYRNLYAIAVAHAVLGLAIAVSLPSHLTHHMMVGLGFYHP